MSKLYKHYLKEAQAVHAKEKDMPKEMEYVVYGDIVIFNKLLDEEKKKAIFERLDRFGFCEVIVRAGTNHRID